jgi:apoptosis-inducing factor 3
MFLRPYKLRIPGAELRHIYTLRSVADANAIAAQAETSKNIVIIGAGFIGLEVAAYFQYETPISIFPAHVS